MSRSYDNGVLCSCEQTLHVPADKRDEIIEVFRANGAYYISDPADVDKIRKKSFANEGKGKISNDIVGAVPQKLCKYYGIDGCPDDAKILILKVDKFAQDEVLAREILCPILRVAPYTDFKEAIENARKNLFMEGAGHSGSIWSNDDEKIEYCGERLPVCRIVVNQGNFLVGGSPVGINGLMPTNSLGCGSWGNNSISENFYFKHLMNITRVAYRIPNSTPPTHADIWSMGPSEINHI